jgi:hypothetical protein
MPYALFLWAMSLIARLNFAYDTQEQVNTQLTIVHIMMISWSLRAISPCQ